MNLIEARMTDAIEPQHRDKFKYDVLAELENLDVSRIADLGISREPTRSRSRPVTCSLLRHSRTSAS